MKTKIKSTAVSAFSFLALISIPEESKAASISLGLARSFTILGATTVTNTGPSMIAGNLGSSPGISITGFPPGIILGTVHQNDSFAAQAQVDASLAYDQLAAASQTQDLTGMNLGGLTLFPGVYFFDSIALLTGLLTLDSGNDPDAQFIFQIGTAFTTESDSQIMGINGAISDQIYFQVGSSTTLGTNSALMGTIISNTSSTLTTGATIDGRVISLNGAVTLDSNTTSIPEPSTLLLGVIAAISAFSRRSRCSRGQ